MADNISVLDSTGTTQTMRAVDNAGVKTAVHILADATGTPVTPGLASSTISTANSTTATLGAAGVFTGTSEDVSNYAVINISVFSDQASATDGLSLQQSSNGTNWDIVDVYTVPASTGKSFSVQPAAKFFRIVYTNGGTIQGAFRLQTVFHQRITKSSSVRPQDGRSNDNDMEEVIAYNALFNGATWDRARGDTTAGIWAQLKAALPAGTATIGGVLNPSPAATTGSITGSAQSVTAALAGYSGGIIAYTGTFSGINAVFEASYDGGTTYVGCVVMPFSGSAPVASLSGASTSTAAYAFYTSGATHFRIRSTAFTSGTMSVTIIPESMCSPSFLGARVAGYDASNSAFTVNPVPVAVASRSTEPTANSNGTAIVPTSTTTGKLVVQPYSIAASEWSYAAAAGGLVSTTGVTAKAAAGAGIRICVAHIDMVNSHATIGTDVQIRDGASGTVLWRGYAAPNGGGCSIDFLKPLRGTANTLLEIAEGTATATNGVYVNMTGFTSVE